MSINSPITLSRLQLQPFDVRGIHSLPSIDNTFRFHLHFRRSLLYASTGKGGCPVTRVLLKPTCYNWQRTHSSCPSNVSSYYPSFSKVVCQTWHTGGRISTRIMKGVLLRRSFVLLQRIIWEIKRDGSRGGCFASAL